MLTQERYEIILNAVSKKHTVNVLELTELTASSESTIRRDLNTMDKKGLLKKIHGGATILQDGITVVEDDIITKNQLNVSEKEKIAKYAASLINDDDFVFIDGGTSTEKLINYIDPNSKCVFVTNGVAHAQLLIRRGFRVNLIGGVLRPITEAIIGADAIDSIKKFNFTKCFVGVNGISIEKGLTTPDIEEACVKRQVLEQSYMRVILADHTKFGKISLVNFGDIKEVCIITDKQTDKSFNEKALIKIAI